ncbi:helix-turn-helix domain-containing protein [Nonomuraea monospora]|uniref:Helix-turn-helix domain-containing protein n=1 Tax=Nonomuraea monospora TaxID=568818 RepID=A0ABN3CF38_9ACTN
MDVISTAEIPAKDRISFWQEVSSSTWVPYELRCEPALRSRFQARLHISDLGSVKAMLMTTTPHSVRRTPKLIRQADPEVFKLSCVVRGRSMMEQDGRHADLGIGDLVLYDTSRPYLAGLVPEERTSRLLLLCFPRSSLTLPAGELRRLSAVRIPGDRGVGALSSQFLRQLALRMDELSPPDLARLSTLTLDVLTVALADTLDAGRAVPPHTRRRALMARIHAFVQRNLGDTSLSPDTIATAHHISLRYLHKLFHDEGHTVTGWLRERRLQQCRHDLADPWLTDRSISTIAARWGFTSSAHFSQAFRSAYGLTPSQFRREHATVRAD